MILGIDEVGRGPWAGPLVIGAVVLPDAFTLSGLTDSKKLTAKKRAELDIVLRKQALGYGLGWVHADELDKIGLSAALRLATIRAVESVKVPYHEIIIDGTINFLKDTSKGQYVTTLAKADALIPAVSAASIIAKVARDTFMAEQAVQYPDYGFEKHVGYGTALHRAAIEAHGVTSLHRRSFAPIAKVAGDKSAKEPVAVGSGALAEARVVDWLVARGYKIIERNWKTKYCEIDIVAEAKGVRYFIEVKYRASQQQGGGTAAITSKKLQQMAFAAKLYDTRHPSALQQRLAVVSLGLVQLSDTTHMLEMIELD